MLIHKILASGSQIRAQLLKNSGLAFDIVVPRVDESAIRDSLVAEAAHPRDIADCLAEAKARKVSSSHPGAPVIGCDQVLALKGALMSKPATPEDALSQIAQLSGQTHHLFSAAVIYENGQPVWRHVGEVRLKMRQLSEGFIRDYVDRNWNSIRHSVGAYKLEEEGVRMIEQMQGNYFHVLGLPLTELINYLVLRGDLET